MAIYKPRRSRWPLIAGVTGIAFILGLAVGALVVGNRAPDLPAAAALIGDGLQGSSQLLEVTQIEYEEAIKPGASEPEFQGSLENLARARARFDAVAPALREIDAQRVAGINQGFEELRTLMEARTPIEQVTSAIEALQEQLAPAPAGAPPA